jgi:DNA-binding NtrC family response regulator
MSFRLLLVEDEPLIRRNLRRMLERHGHHVSEAGCVAQAMQQQLSNFDLIISDVRLPGEAGTVLIERAKPVPVLIMTSYNDTRDAVNAMRAGAIHYLIKPFDHQELLTAIDSTLGNTSTPPEQNAQNNFGMVGKSPKMQQLFEEIQTVAPLSTTVLIHGESGTGKELVARALHQLSPRAHREMIAVNCAAIPESLMEDELFGHEKGAFTGASTTRKGLVEAADQSTLFLDEIGELPLEAQARLLRLLQEREIRRLGTHETRKVDIRLIAATHRNLEHMVKEGSFRADLFFRLNVVALQLPALRQRGDDLLLLANEFIRLFCQRHGKPLLTLDPETAERLQRHSWPGNIRELQNVLEYAVIMCKGRSIPPQLVRLADMSYDPVIEPPNTPAIPVLTTPQLIESIDLPVGSSLLQHQFIETVRQLESQYTETELAEKLGISRKTLWERRQKLGIPRAPKRKS